MTAIGSNSAITALRKQGAMPLSGALAAGQALNTPDSANGKTDELREKFTQFVGEAFFGQMLKAMRSTVGKPAYFNGGHAEEVFQGQLDQTMAEQLTKASASKFAEPMFERQFPQLAETSSNSSLHQLEGLSRM
jgi:Rod binding domain-containing protein